MAKKKEAEPVEDFLTDEQPPKDEPAVNDYYDKPPKGSHFEPLK